MDTSSISSGGTNSNKILEVDSCFGGLAIYRYDIIKDCAYSYRDAVPPHMLDCEHVLFHKCLKERNGAKIFSNPQM
jgi:hypothetical protein